MYARKPNYIINYKVIMSSKAINLQASQTLIIHDMRLSTLD